MTQSNSSRVVHKYHRGEGVENGLKDLSQVKMLVWHGHRGCAKPFARRESGSVRRHPRRQATLEPGKSYALLTRVRPLYCIEQLSRFGL